MLLYNSSSKFHGHATAATSLQDVPFFKYWIEQLPVVATLWNGLMASFALTVAISLLPSLLMFLAGRILGHGKSIQTAHWGQTRVSWVLYLKLLGSRSYMM